MQFENFDRFEENWNDEKIVRNSYSVWSVANSVTETELRQNHVMWLQSRDVIKMIRCQDEWIEIDSINLNIYRKDCSS
jgi:hypothetical protein